MIAVLIRRGKHQGRLRHRTRTACEDEGRDGKCSYKAKGGKAWWPPEARRRQGKTASRASERDHGSADTLIPDFQPPELLGNKFLLLCTAIFGALPYGTHGK